MKKSNHQANIIRVSTLLPHNNADTLELIKIGGYQVVSKKGTFKQGDLAVYIQPDSVVPQTRPFRFIWEPGGCQVPPAGWSCTREAGHEGPCAASETQQVSERRRRITVRKFRGEWSEGLLLPLSDFSLSGQAGDTLIKGSDGFYQFKFNEGDDVSALLGITHYDPDKGVERTSGNNEGAPKRRRPKTLKGWLFFILYKLGLRGARGQLSEAVDFSLPVYDVAAFKNFTTAFTSTDKVEVTEKIHGSNARYVFLDGKMYAGSRTLWKAPTSNCVWRKALKQNPWIEQWCREHEGYALYGEVVPTQKGFDYGCKPGEPQFFCFDVRTPDGKWLPAYDSEGVLTKHKLGIPFEGMVPQLYTGVFDLNEIRKYVDGDTMTLYGKHIREGVVVKPMYHERSVPGLGRLILKVVSNRFLEKDSK